MLASDHWPAASDQTEGDNEARHDHRGQDRNRKRQMPLDSGLDPFAVAIEQDRDHEEASTAGDDRKQDEQPYIVAGKAGGDRDELVGDRGYALHQDDQRTPFGIGGAECLDLIAET